MKKDFSNRPNRDWEHTCTQTLICCPIYLAREVNEVNERCIRKLKNFLNFASAKIGWDLFPFFTVDEHRNIYHFESLCQTNSNIHMMKYIISSTDFTWPKCGAMKVDKLINYGVIRIGSGVIFCY